MSGKTNGHRAFSPNTQSLIKLNRYNGGRFLISAKCNRDTWGKKKKKNLLLTFDIIWNAFTIRKDEEENEEKKKKT